MRSLEVSIATGASGPVLVLAGEADFTSITRLDEALTAQISGQAVQLTIDAANLRYADSASMRTLVMAAMKVRTRAGSVTLLDPQPPVARMLDLLCVDEMFSIRDRAAGETHPAPARTAADGGGPPSRSDNPRSIFRRTGRGLTHGTAGLLTRRNRSRHVRISQGQVRDHGHRFRSGTAFSAARGTNPESSCSHRSAYRAAITAGVNLRAACSRHSRGSKPARSGQKRLIRAWCRHVVRPPRALPDRGTLRLRPRSPGSGRGPFTSTWEKQWETILANESGPKAGVEGVAEDVKGRAKEAAGAVSGNESLKQEGEAQQDKAAAQRDVAAKEAEAEKARAEAGAAEAEQRSHQ